MGKVMPTVSACHVEFCAFNGEGRCKAIAINVGGPGPDCDTFTVSDQKCSGTVSDAGVGACKVKSCIYNDCLLCAATSISVTFGKNHAECAAYISRLAMVS